MSSSLSSKSSSSSSSSFSLSVLFSFSSSSFSSSSISLNFSQNKFIFPFPPEIPSAVDFHMLLCKNIPGKKVTFENLLGSFFGPLLEVIIEKSTEVLL
jgi:hypothetical protein